MASRNLVFGHCEILPSKAGSFRLVFLYKAIEVLNLKRILFSSVFCTVAFGELKDSIQQKNIIKYCNKLKAIGLQPI